MNSIIAERVRGLPPSGLQKFFDLLSQLDQVLSLGLGEPDLPTPEPIRLAGIAAIQRGRVSYTSNAGALELRLRVAAYLERRYGVHYDPEEEVLITVGVSEGLHAALLTLVNPGEEVLIPEPCFVAYAPCVRFAQGVPLFVPTRMEDGFRLQVESLAGALSPRAKVLLLNYPNNPTGAVMAREELAKVAHFVQEQGLFVISDEIYDRFVYEGSHVCFPALPGMRERTVLLGGLSKSYAMTGWRVGYACGPREVIQAMLKVHQHIVMSAPTIGQLGGIEALDPSRDHAREIVQAFAQRRKLVLQVLDALGLPYARPGGAFYVFPSIQETGLSGFAFSEQLLREESVAVIPGEIFGPSGAGCIRIAYTLPSPQLDEALGRFQRFTQRLLGRA